MCRKNSILFVALAAIAMPAFAVTPLFGPKKFVRTSGKPNVYNETLTVTDTTQPCTLKVYNGQNGQNKISSASIVVNGVEVVKENEFNQQVDSIVKPIQCRGSNRMTITLKAAPQGFITVGVYGKSSGMQLVWEKEYPTNTTLGPFSYINGGINPDTMFFVKDNAGISIFNASGNIVSTIPMTNDEFIGGISPNGRYIDIKKPNPVYYDSMGIDDLEPFVCYSRIVDLYGNLISSYDKSTRRSHVSNDGKHSLDYYSRVMGPSRLVFRNNGSIAEFTSMNSMTTQGAYSSNGDLYVICWSTLAEGYDNTYQKLWSTVFNASDSFKYRPNPAVGGKHVYISPDGQRIQANLVGCGLLFNVNGSLIKINDKRFDFISFTPDSRYFCAISSNELYFIDAGNGNILWQHSSETGYYPIIEATENNIIALRDESEKDPNSMCWLEIFTYDGALLYNYLLPGIKRNKFGTSEINIIKATDSGENAIVVWRNQIMSFQVR